MNKPNFITEETLQNYVERKCRIGGMVKNEYRPSNPLSKELLADMKDIGMDYIITCYTEETQNTGVRDNINSLLETMTNADEVGMDVIVSHRVLNKNRRDSGVTHTDDKPRAYWYYAENKSVDKINEVLAHKSFAGILHDEPNDTDETFEIISDSYNFYKEQSENIKMDLNLFPNYTNVFNDNSTTFNKNKWNTGRSFKEYVDRYAQVSDTIGVDYYPIVYSETDGKYSIPSSRIKTWAECFDTLAQIHHKYPEKDYKIFIQTSSHNSYGVVTPTILSMQTYAALIGGANDIRYFCLTDNDAPSSAVTSFDNSPYTSDHNGFGHGTIYDIVKEFNNGKFKYIKDYVASKYIDHVDIYNLKNESVKIPGNIDNLDEFIFDSYSYGYNMFSVGYDNEAAYCFVVNLNLTGDSAIRIANDDNIVVVNCDENGVFTEYTDTKYLQVNIHPGDICILKKYYKEESPKGTVDTKIKKPDFITDDLLSKYKDNTCKLYGFIGNFETEDALTIPTKAFIDMKDNLHLDYLVSHFKKNNLDRLVESLENSENSSKLPTINDWEVFRENNKVWITDERINRVRQYSTFGGVVLFDQPSVRKPKKKSANGKLVSASDSFTWMMRAYAAYKKLNPPVFAESNLYPNFGLFTDKIMIDGDVDCYNAWYTNQSFESYIDDCLPYNDSICIDYYIFKCDAKTGENPYIIGRSPSGPQAGWHPLTLYNGKLCYAEFLKKLLEVHKAHPEMPFKRYIETSHDTGTNSDGTTKHNSPKMTPKTLSVQSWATLISGANNIGYFLINDIDGSFIESPYTHNYEYGATYNILKEFNNGKFIYLKDFIASKYIHCLDYLVGSKPLLKVDNDYFERFIKEYEGELIYSIGFDDIGTYCFIANMSIDSDLKLKVNKDTTFMDFDKNGIITEEKYKVEADIVVEAGDICVLRKKYNEATNTAVVPIEEDKPIEKEEKKPNVFKRIWNKIVGFFKSIF